MLILHERSGPRSVSNSFNNQTALHVHHLDGHSERVRNHMGYIYIYHTRDKSVVSLLARIAPVLLSQCFADDDDELMLNVLRCHLTY